METLPTVIHASWKPHLTPLFQSDHLKYLKYKVLPSAPFYPKSEDIFNVFSMPLSDIQVVVLGQDPYPNPHQAIGYAFAVPQSVEMPFSLRTISTEVIRSIDLKEAMSPEWRTLEHWRDQGVFLLNTALTVEAGKPNSHSVYWNWFTHQVIGIISREVKPIWLLWGANARGQSAYIENREQNYVLTAPHPASEAYKSGKFIGCNHFNDTNAMLIARGKKPINW